LVPAPNRAPMQPIAKTGAVLSDFKEFLVKQNILALALAVIVGTALNGVVKALVDNVIMPLASLVLPGGEWQTVVWEVGGAKIGVGVLAAALVNFLIVGFVAWRLAKMFIADVPAAPAPVCPFCRIAVDANATRCGHCTSEMSPVIA
jgi:large conductance mechanosensitive channel